MQDGEKLSLDDALVKAAELPEARQGNSRVAAPLLHREDGGTKPSPVTRLVGRYLSTAK